MIRMINTCKADKRKYFSQFKDYTNKQVNYFKDDTNKKLKKEDDARYEREIQ
jgi:hypothetical protein